MCGRFVAASTPDEIAGYFGADAVAETLIEDDGPGPSYNVAPTADVKAVFQRADERRVAPFHWGLVPSWAKDPSIGSRMINARAETVAEKNAFKRSLRLRRCLLPVDGFYEWTKIDGHKKKQPWFIHRPDGELMAFAGLWAAWRPKDAAEDDDWLFSCTILTGAANAAMAPIHNRMPIMVPPGDWATWLDPDTQDHAAIEHLLVPPPDELITCHAVSIDVNNARNHGAHLVEPIDSIDPDGTGSPRPAADVLADLRSAS